MTIKRPDPARGPLLHRRRSGWQPSSDADDRRDRLGHRGALLHASPRRRRPTSTGRSRRRAQAFDDGPVAADDPRRAGRVPAGDRRAGCGSGPRTSARSGRASPACSHAIAQLRRGIGAAAHLRLLRRSGRHVPVRGAGPADRRRRVRPARPRAGRRGRRDHPVERADGADQHTSSPPRCSPAARSCSSPRRRRRARATWSPRSPRPIGLPPGVLNVVTADREVSELLVRDPRVDKITFTGSTAAGRRIASICGERIARCTLELGGKSAAVILDDVDLETRPRTLAQAECLLSGQVCSSLTRIVVTRSRHDELVEALAGDVLPGAGRRPVRRRQPDGPAGRRAAARPGRGLHRQGRRRAARPWPPAAAARRTSTAAGTSSRPCSATSTTLGHRPGGDLRPGADRHPGRRRGGRGARSPTTPSTGSTPRCSPTTSTGPAQVAGQLRSGTVGHNAFRTDFGIAFGGFKQSGIGREGGRRAAAVPRDQDRDPRGPDPPATAGTPSFNGDRP